MLRQFTVGVALTRCQVGRSFVTQTHSASCRPLIPSRCLAAGGCTISSWSPSCRSASYRLLADRCFVPAVSRIVPSPAPLFVPWCRTFERQKNMYYGFGSRHPPPPSRIAKCYYAFLIIGLAVTMFTPL